MEIGIGVSEDHVTTISSLLIVLELDLVAIVVDLVPIVVGLVTIVLDLATIVLAKNVIVLYRNEKVLVLGSIEDWLVTFAGLSHSPHFNSG